MTGKPFHKTDKKSTLPGGLSHISNDSSVSPSILTHLPLYFHQTFPSPLASSPYLPTTRPPGSHHASTSYPPAHLVPLSSCSTPVASRSLPSSPLPVSASLTSLFTSSLPPPTSGSSFSILFTITLTILPIDRS